MDSTPVEPVLLRVSEAASLLGLGRTTLYELMKSGEIKTVRIGRAVRIPLRVVRDYAERITAEQSEG